MFYFKTFPNDNRTKSWILNLNIKKLAKKFLSLNTEISMNFLTITHLVFEEVVVLLQELLFVRRPHSRICERELISETDNNNNKNTTKIHADWVKNTQTYKETRILTFCIAFTLYIIVFHKTRNRGFVGEQKKASLICLSPSLCAG